MPNLRAPGHGPSLVRISSQDSAGHRRELGLLLGFEGADELERPLAACSLNSYRPSSPPQSCTPIELLTDRKGVLDSLRAS